MPQGTQLFSTNEWAIVAANQRRRLEDEVNNLDEDTLFKTPIHELCTYLAQSCKIAIPSLHRDKIVVDQRATQVDVSQDRTRYVKDRSRPLWVAGTLISVYIPFEGDPASFFVQPSTFTFHPPHGDVHGKQLVLYIEGVNLMADLVRAQIQQLVGDLNQNLRYLQTDAERFNGNLVSYAYALVEQRRKRLLTERSLETSLTFKLKERTSDAPFAPAPLNRRRATPTLRPPSPTDEPILDTQDFEQIIELIQATAATLQHSPAALKTMQDTTLRSHFLIPLNAQFDSNGTETFTFASESDIVIRTNAKQIFMAECRFWAGPRALTSALDQLVAAPSWHDAKALLVVFNRDQSFAQMLNALVTTIKGHSSFKRQLPQLEESIFPCLLTHRDDRTCNIYLTVLAFDLTNTTPY